MVPRGHHAGQCKVEQQHEHESQRRLTYLRRIVGAHPSDTSRKALLRGGLSLRQCGTSVRVVRRGIHANLLFIISRSTHCPSCGTSDVTRGHKRDAIDTVSRHPLSLLMRVSGAPLFRCFACRLQYYDWRPRIPERSAYEDGQ